MWPAMLLAPLIAPWFASAALTVAPNPCPAPADLPPGGDAAYLTPEAGGADLSPPPYRLPGTIHIPLRLYLPPPAPFGTEAELGAAVVDLQGGAIRIGSGDTRARSEHECGADLANP